MNPVAMTALLGATLCAFAWSANRRFQLLKVGAPEPRFDHLDQRIVRVLRYALAQTKMFYYPRAGAAHLLIFIGFNVLLLNSIVLFVRGFVPGFYLPLLGPEDTLTPIYGFVKDISVLGVIAGVLVFFYYRVINPQKRMALHTEGLVILGIIGSMMVADLAYWGSLIVLEAHETGVPVAFHASEPGTSFMAIVLDGFGASPSALRIVGGIGFWMHSSWVLLFLNLLPYSKHFHIITGLPNVFFSDLTPPGRLRPIPDLEGTIERVMEEKAGPDDRIGAEKIEDFSWKAILDFYTCTECGRCSDNCPAFTTGKLLSPKKLTLDLRDHLYAREVEYLERPGGPRPAPGGDAHGHGHDDHAHGHAPNGHGANGHSHGGNGHDHAHDDHGHAKDDHGHAHGDDDHGHGHDDHDHHEVHYDPPPLARLTQATKVLDLVPEVIHPDVLWGCTTCRACEEQCPVMISYVDKIVDMRRNLVLMKEKFPSELGAAFRGMETNGNPWNLSAMDRANWAEGLDVPLMSDHPHAEILFWVGCAASYDSRAQKIARSTAQLMQRAGVDFSILGSEETCTGDSARRAGNEFLFEMLAKQNVETLNGYSVKKVVTTCPHCFNTLKNEYGDYGGKYEVIHHTDFLLGLLAEGRLVPRKQVKAKVVFHDSCYLGRYNDIYDAPRRILERIPGVQIVEADASKAKGLCCGAGGAQMWMEEQNENRVNRKRTLQLVDTGAKVITSACPFCQTMIVDGLKDLGLEEEVRQLDVAEALAESLALTAPAGVRAAMPQDPPRAAPSALK